MFERAQAVVDSTLTALRGATNTVMAGPEEWALLEEMWQGAMEMADRAAQARNAARRMLADAKEAAEDARNAVEAEERESAAERAADAAAAAAAKETAAATKAAAESEAALERAQAQLAELELAHLRTRSQLAHVERERVAPVARHVWGAGTAASTPPPKVISLVGQSPASIRTIGESRAISQQITGAEERHAIDRLWLGESPPSP